MNAVSSNGNGNGVTETTATATPKQPSKAKLKTLFAEYSKLDDKLAALEAAIEGVRVERSTLVKAIHDEGGKGPYMYKGERYKVVARGDGYFFRGEGRSDLIEVG